MIGGLKKVTARRRLNSKNDAEPSKPGHEDKPSKIKRPAPVDTQAAERRKE
jgi:hypothetical protein